MAVPGCVATVRPHTIPGAARCARSIVSVQSAAGAQSASRKQITYAPWRRDHAMPAFRVTAGPELAARRSSTSCRRTGADCVTGTCQEVHCTACHPKARGCNKWLGLVLVPGDPPLSAQRLPHCAQPPGLSQSETQCNAQQQPAEADIQEAQHRAPTIEKRLPVRKVLGE